MARSPSRALAISHVIQLPGTAPRVFLYGYYGCGNLGDDLLLAATVDGISGPLLPTTIAWPTAAPRGVSFAASTVMVRGMVVLSGGSGQDLDQADRLVRVVPFSCQRAIVQSRSERRFR